MFHIPFDSGIVPEFTIKLIIVYLPYKKTIPYEQHLSALSDVQPLESNIVLIHNLTYHNLSSGIDDITFEGNPKDGPNQTIFIKRSLWKFGGTEQVVHSIWRKESLTFISNRLVTNKRFSLRFLRTSATCKKIFLEISADICYMQYSGYQRFPRDFGGHLLHATVRLPMISYLVKFSPGPALLCCYYRRVTSLHSYRAQPCCKIHAGPAGLLLATLKRAQPGCQLASC